MASYVKSSLATGENIIEQAKLSKICLYFPAVLSFILFIVTIVVMIKNKDNPNELAVLGGVFAFGFFIATIAYYIKARIIGATTELALTNRRVLAKFGVIKRDAIDLRLSKIESIVFQQSILGRIFNYGSITINGTGSKSSPIKAIANPMEFKKSVDNYISEHIDGIKS